jgi:hypothetical protein
MKKEAPSEGRGRGKISREPEKPKDVILKKRLRSDVEEKVPEPAKPTKQQKKDVKVVEEVPPKVIVKEEETKIKKEKKEKEKEPVVATKSVIKEVK